MTHLWRDVLRVEVTTPFPRLTYQEAMMRFGSDKPDLRFGLELRDVTAIAGESSARFLQDAAKTEGVNPATYRMYIAPLIFSLAPAINTLLSLLWHPKPGDPWRFDFEIPGWKLPAGIVLVALGTFLVLMSKEEVEAHKGPSTPKPAEVTPAP